MKENTKDKIIRIAVELLEKEGIRSLTQPAVAKLVGIPQGQLTYHFPKRSDLILAVADSAINRIADFVFQQAEKSGSKAKVIDMIWALVKNHSRIRAMLSLAIEADDNEAVRKRLQEQGQRARMVIGMGMGTNAEDAAVTMAHATMLGFGVLSFIGDKNDKKIHQDFEFAMGQLQKIKTEKKKKEKT